jgi:hypothetical protein
MVLNMNKILIASGLLLGVVTAVIVYRNVVYLPSQNSDQQSQDQVHYHAGFQVYINDQLQDYSGFEHMKIEPCHEGEHPELTREEEQLEKAHLHDGIGDVVHVHRSQALWQDLFINADIPIEQNVIVYINSKQVDDFFSREIQPYESVVIFQGENTDIEDKLAKAVTQDHIIEVEGMSENCGS